MEGRERRKNQQPACMYYLQGRCRYGESCYYSHQGFSEALMVRHAESEFNKIVNNTPNWGQTDEPHLIHYNKDLIDCHLSQKGRQSCANTLISEQYLGKNREVDIVFVSPMNRTLQTADIMIAANKIKAKKIIMIPQLSQVLSKICDFGGCLIEKRERYKNCDFSQIQRFLQQNTHVKDEKHWQDAFVDHQHRKFIKHKKENGHRYVRLLEQIFPTPLQSSERCFNRAMRALDRMKQIVEIRRANKILVFSHNRILKYIDGRFSKGRGRSFENCEIRKLIF